MLSCTSDRSFGWNAGRFLHRTRFLFNELWREKRGEMVSKFVSSGVLSIVFVFGCYVS